MGLAKAQDADVADFVANGISAGTSSASAVATAGWFSANSLMWYTFRICLFFLDAWLVYGYLRPYLAERLNDSPGSPKPADFAAGGLAFLLSPRSHDTAHK